MKRSLDVRIGTSPWKRERFGSAPIRSVGLRRVGASGTRRVIPVTPERKQVDDELIMHARHCHKAALAVLGQPQYDATGRVIGYDDPGRNRSGKAKRLDGVRMAPCKACGQRTAWRLIKRRAWNLGGDIAGFWCPDHGPDSKVTLAEW
jgi:hypothetical protein